MNVFALSGVVWHHKLLSYPLLTLKGYKVMKFTISHFHPNVSRIVIYVKETKNTVFLDGQIYPQNLIP